MMPTRAWPRTLRSIAQIVGTGPTEALARAHAGAVLYVPHQLGPGHALARVLGLEAARRLAGVSPASTAAARSRFP